MTPSILTSRPKSITNLPFIGKPVAPTLFRRSSLRIAIAASSDDAENTGDHPDDFSDEDLEMPPRKKRRGGFQKGGFQKKVQIVEPPRDEGREADIDEEPEEELPHKSPTPQPPSSATTTNGADVAPIENASTTPEATSVPATVETGEQPEQQDGQQSEQQSIQQTEHLTETLVERLAGQEHEQEPQPNDVQLPEGFVIPPKPITLPEPPQIVEEPVKEPTPEPAEPTIKLQEKGLASLPVPILTQILKLLQSRELSALATTCQTINQIFTTRKLEITSELGQREGYSLPEIRTLDLYRPGGMTTEARYLVHKYCNWSNSTEQISIPEIMELSPIRGMVYLPELRQLKSNRKYAESWIRQRYPTTFAETKAQKMQKIRGYFLIMTTFLAHLHPFPRPPLKVRKPKAPTTPPVPLDPITGQPIQHPPQWNPNPQPEPPKKEPEGPVYDPLEPDNRLIFDHSACHELSAEDWKLYWNMIETIELTRVFHAPTNQWLGIFAPACYRDRCFETELAWFMSQSNIPASKRHGPKGGEERYWKWEHRQFDRLDVYTGQERDSVVRWEKVTETPSLDTAGITPAPFDPDARKEKHNVEKREVVKKGWRQLIVRKYELETHIKQRKEWAWVQRKERKRKEAEEKRAIREALEAQKRALEEEMRVERERMEAEERERIEAERRERGEVEDVVMGEESAPAAATTVTEPGKEGEGDMEGVEKTGATTEAPTESPAAAASGTPAATETPQPTSTDPATTTPAATTAPQPAEGTTAPETQPETTAPEPEKEKTPEPPRDPNAPVIAPARKDAREAPIQNLFLRWKCVYHNVLGIDDQSWGETGEVKDENPYF
ncbi:hypothetical protein BJ508DRAFT_328943 [Ascobolus immersus RN42]|uniref:F-box domain-containing protein n=1 Tax=Ascobolus immersus RN42 TaxID=1160509 RepID=A0A3N4HY47_ASCIM|nr:hypothetical protein BJ508DRAFT_328943 [Ascobolus immersus RN42]